MTSSLLLDGLLLLIVLLFIPIGLWRGVVKEAVVAGSILLGGALAAAWARPWGDDLANQLDLRPQAARFVVAVVALLGATLCIGYAGGAALRPGPPGPLGRVVGGVLAGLNGLLLLGYGLGFLDQYMLERTSVPMLTDGFVTRFLLHQFGWLLLALVAFILPVILTAVLFPLARDDRVDDPVDVAAGDEAMVGSSMTRSRPVRVPHSADAGKFEPVHGYGTRPDTAQHLGGRFPDGATTGLRATDLSMSDRPPAPPPSRSRADQSTVSPGTEPVEAGEATRTGTVIVDEWLQRAARPSLSSSNEERQAGEAIGSDSHPEQHAGCGNPVGGHPSSGPWANSTSGRTPDRPVLRVVSSSAADGSGEIGSERARGNERGGDADAGGTREGRRCPSCNARIRAVDTYCSTCGSFAS